MGLNCGFLRLVNSGRFTLIQSYGVTLLKGYKENDSWRSNLIPAQSAAVLNTELVRYGQRVQA